MLASVWVLRGRSRGIEDGRESELVKVHAVIDLDSDLVG